VPRERPGASSIRRNIPAAVFALEDGTPLHPPNGADAVQVIHFPKPFQHAHPPVRNVNEIEINRKAEEEVRAVLEHLSAQDEALAKIVEAMAARMNGNGKG
jgi:hypothetical protein